MTNEQFKYIWITKIVANGPWGISASDEHTAKLYRDKLSKYDKNVLSDAVDRMLVDETGKLPSVGKFIEYCRWVKGERGNPNPKLCPCCQNTGWIYLKEKNTTIRCDCVNCPDMLKISTHYNQDKKCEAGECRPGGKVFVDEKPVKLPGCPKGEPHYKKYLLEPLQKESSLSGDEEPPF
jgi:hypothetical protein